MAMSTPTPQQVTGWVEQSTREQVLPFRVADQGTVTAAVALLREGRKPERARGARPGGSG